MPELYPLLLLPEFKERVWGSRDLSLLYPHKTARKGGEFEQPIGEVWLTGDECRVSNGDLAGQTLAEVTQRFGRGLIGETAPDPSRFPLLIKFLFPKEKLSVQVHPDDAAARAAGLSNGKTECWYVLAAEPSAQVALGLKPGVSKSEVERAIAETRLEPLLDWIGLKPGEMIYVDAGTIHAIGPGSVLVETQQNSDTTYRLYDYGRPRELHVRQGLAAMKEKTRAGKVSRQGSGSVCNLISTPDFIVDKFVVKELMDVKPRAGKSSAQVLVALDGCGIVEADGMRPVTFAKGECVVLPAALREYRLRPQWALECLRAMLPGETVPEPETTR
ncbi:MAG: class I mannose-6-phosphate isomerase [Acidobacteriales bacterium]|nr:class I mannose-6-phosphate isomerase [Terriglobales bacterium]